MKAVKTVPKAPKDRRIQPKKATFIPDDIADTLAGVGPKRPPGSRLSVEDQLFIVWGISREWSNGKIARMLPAEPPTIRNYRARILENPLLVLKLPVLNMPTARIFQCRFCGEYRPTHKRAARHILAHVLPDEVARGTDLTRLKMPL